MVQALSPALSDKSRFKIKIHWNPETMIKVPPLILTLIKFQELMLSIFVEQLISNTINVMYLVNIGPGKKKKYLSKQQLFKKWLFIFSSPEPKAQGELLWSAFVRRLCRRVSIYLVNICRRCVNIYLVNTIQATLCTQLSRKFVEMFVLMKSRSSSNLGHVESKARLVGQIIENLCAHSRGHSFGPIFFKLAQNIYPHNISIKI